MRFLTLLLFVGLFPATLFAADWRKMSPAELKAIVPAKAPVIRETIETEFRTASGITDGKQRIFGVIIITAGYEADGKYTHFFRTGAKIRLDNLELAAGDYIFGYKRVDNDNLRVTFYRAQNGAEVGAVTAKVERKRGPVYSFLIEPPISNRGVIRIGRFALGYSL